MVWVNPEIVCSNLEIVWRNPQIVYSQLKIIMGISGDGQVIPEDDNWIHEYDQ